MWIREMPVKRERRGVTNQGSGPREMDLPWRELRMGFPLRQEGRKDGKRHH